MRKQIHKFGLLGAVLIFAVVSGSIVSALPSPATVNAETAETTSVGDADATNPRKPTTTGQANGQARLAAAQLKACQKREKAITNIMARIGDRGQKQLDMFGKIAERTEDFYTEKAKPLSNYDALVAEVSAKNTDAQAAVDATKSTGGEFACEGTDPKGVAATFKESLKSQDDALKAYKTAIKNLIVGVKSVQGTTTSADNKTTGGDQ